MQSNIVQIRVEPTLKQKAEALFQSIGLDTTAAIRLFFMQSLLRGTIPFEIKKTRPCVIISPNEMLVK